MQNQLLLLSSQRLLVLFVAIVSLMLGCMPAHAQRSKKHPPQFEGAEERVYKQVGDVELMAWIFTPEEHKSTDARPGIVFFFGGGWRSGSPAQFEQHCRYLAARGMVAITVDYRVSSRHKSQAADSVEDAQDAIRWIRNNSQELGINSEQIVASGGSAGGHLAACCGLMGDDKDPTSSIPNAMVLFNPAVVLAPVEGEANSKLTPEKLKELEARMGVPPKELSPYHQLPKKTGPCLIFHGEADTTVPFRSVELFESAMKEAGNHCELKGFEDEGHGFFNYGRKGNAAFRATVRMMDEFLVELGYLTAEVSPKAEKILK